MAPFIPDSWTDGLLLKAGCIASNFMFCSHYRRTVLLFTWQLLETHPSMLLTTGLSITREFGDALCVSGEVMPNGIA
jgi:hypothetical protein